MVVKVTSKTDPKNKTMSAINAKKSAKEYEPTHDELFEYAQEKSRLMIKLNMMKGSAYKRGRNDAIDRFSKKYEKIEKWSNANKSRAREILSKGKN